VSFLSIISSLEYVNTFFQLLLAFLFIFLRCYPEAYTFVFAWFIPSVFFVEVFVILLRYIRKQWLISVSSTLKDERPQQCTLALIN
jgi:hypothetical protein